MLKPLDSSAEQRSLHTFGERGRPTASAPAGLDKIEPQQRACRRSSDELQESQRKESI